MRRSPAKWIVLGAAVLILSGVVLGTVLRPYAIRYWEAVEQFVADFSGDKQAASEHRGGAEVPPPPSNPPLPPPLPTTLPPPPVAVPPPEPVLPASTPTFPIVPAESTTPPIPIPPVPELAAVAVAPAPPPPKPAPPKKAVEPKVVGAFSPGATCVYEDGKTWKNWGGAPYGKNPDDSLSDAKLDWMLKCSSIPERLREKLKAKVRANPKGERTTYLTPETEVKEMTSGPDSRHRTQFMMRDVTVAKIMVAFGIVRAAEAIEWTVEDDDGTVYRFAYVLKCGNLALLGTERRNLCVEVSFNAPPGGHVRWGVGRTLDPLPPDACNAQRQGTGAWTAWYGECDLCVPALAYIRTILGSVAQVYHRYYYPVREERQTLRFSEAVWESVLYLCLEYPDGSQTCGVYTRPQDWNRRHRVDIPGELWRTDKGDCPS